ncbi:peptidase domain-containing ABC transporter [Streptomyces sp. NPDC059161]|uniref:peptidase domain-containing ABC transporter n=1 Tax=unclassified Streptomyces TaxID=2593676 RepID=UPI003667D128
MPFVPQQEISDCAAACLAMVFAFRRVSADFDRLRTLLAPTRGAVSARRIAEVVRAHGLTAKGVRAPLKGLGELPPGSVLFWNRTHFVVLRRLTRRYLVVMDPAVGPRHVPLDTAARLYSGIAIKVEPGEGATAAAADFAAPAKRRPWRHIRLFLNGGRLASAILAISAVLVAATLALPLVTDWLVSSVLPRQEFGDAYVLGIGCLVMVATVLALQVARGLGVVRMEARMDEHATLTLLDRVLAQPYHYFTRRSIGDINMRVRSTEYLRQLMSATTFTSIFDGALVVIDLVIAFWFDPVAGAVLLALAFVAAAVLLTGFAYQKRRAGELIESQARSQAELTEILSGVKTIKSGGLETHVRERWRTSLRQEIDSRVRQRTVNALTTSAAGALAFGGPLVMLYVCTLRYLDGALELGRMLAVVSLSSMVFALLGSFITSFLGLAWVDRALRRVDDVMRAVPEQAEPRPEFAGGIESVGLRGVTFRYDSGERPVLAGVELRIDAGETVGIAGPSGSGKSTLAMVLGLLHAPDEGQVVINGADAAQWDLTSLRRCLGIVTQEATLFAGTIRENILIGSTGVGEEEMREAARTAEIDEEIMSLPLKYDTVLPFNGATLSGGQRQRIAIARAVVRRPGLVILDEATNAVDHACERRIIENLRAWGGAQIFITHRREMLTLADRVLTVRSGGVVETGADAEHLVASGRVADGHRVVDPVPDRSGEVAVFPGVSAVPDDGRHQRGDV